MLFVLVMEVLNHAIGWLDSNGRLSLVGANLPHRVSLYADEVVLFIAPQAI
jgi:hypothetical protein